MKVELKGKVKFKEFVVFQVNSVTGEVKFMQDFDVEGEARSRAKKVTRGLLVGGVFRFIDFGGEVVDTLDSQLDEAAWEEHQRQQRGGGPVILPGRGMKV